MVPKAPSVNYSLVAPAILVLFKVFLFSGIPFLVLSFLAVTIKTHALPVIINNYSLASLHWVTGCSHQTDKSIK
jgi:hypothetical protein